jgi:hypothetical protein
MAKTDKFGPDGAITGGKHDSNMHAGMTKKSANPDNHGVSIGGHTIDSGATRDSTAPTPGTLGPRKE